MNPTYLATARLMAEIAPTVFESGMFALKGGTAINLFLRDMPRLSVDSISCSPTIGCLMPTR
jgi:Nucleotidyl transferase AbiEii toxin, Type IV TA system